MSLEKIFEGLKTATPETLAATVDAAQGAIKDFLFQEKTSSRDAARSEMYDTFKSKMTQTFPNAFGDNAPRMKWEDMIGGLAEKMKTLPPSAPVETPEQMKGRMESEYQTTLKKEREKMVMDSAYSEIEAAAISRKLDEAYVPVFKAALRSEVLGEMSPDGRPMFKGSDGKYFTREGQHATTAQVAEDILKRYPKFLSETVRAPQPPIGQGGGTTISQLSKIRSGLSELKWLNI